MNKKILFLVSIIISLISIIFLVLSYTGYIRVNQIYTNNIDHFMKNYKKLPKGSENNKVVVSIPYPYINDNDNETDINTLDQQHKIEIMLKSLLNQTVKVNMFSLNTYQNVDLPGYIGNICNVYKMKSDFGFLHSLIPSLFREKESNTILIIVKKYKIFGENFIEEVIDLFEKNHNKIIETEDVIVTKPDFFNYDKLRNTDFRIFNGFDDCLNCILNDNVTKILFDYKNNLEIKRTRT